MSVKLEIIGQLWTPPHLSFSWVWRSLYFFSFLYVSTVVTSVTKQLPNFYSLFLPHFPSSVRFYKSNIFEDRKVNRIYCLLYGGILRPLNDQWYKIFIFDHSKLKLYENIQQVCCFADFFLNFCLYCLQSYANGIEDLCGRRVQRSSHYEIMSVARQLFGTIYLPKVAQFTYTDKWLRSYQWFYIGKYM